MSSSGPVTGSLLASTAHDIQSSPADRAFLTTVSSPGSWPAAAISLTRRTSVT